MLKKIISLFYIPILLFCFSSGALAKSIFVKIGGDGDGTSWEKAHGDINSVMKNAGNGDQIHVAAGDYKISRSDYSFNNQNVSMFGGYPKNGFSGTVTDTGGTAGRDKDHVNPDNETILNGNGSIRVIYNNKSNVLIDGFTIKNGHSSSGSGGGVWSNASITLRNCRITDNYASICGGVHAEGKSTELTIENCTWKNNKAKNRGGGIHASGNKFTLSNSTLFDNETLEGDRSGKTGESAVFFIENVPNSMITNCTFSSNRRGNEKSYVMYFKGGSATMINCTISNNTGVSNGSPGVIYLSDGSLSVFGNVIAGNIQNKMDIDGTGTLKTLGYNMIYNAGPYHEQVFGSGMKPGNSYPGNAVPGNKFDVSPKDNYTGLGPLKITPPGNTETHAIDAKDPESTLAYNYIPAAAYGTAGISLIKTDQRGVKRPQRGDMYDVGAFELRDDLKGVEITSPDMSTILHSDIYIRVGDKIELGHVKDPLDAEVPFTYKWTSENSNFAQVLSPVNDERVWVEGRGDGIAKIKLDVYQESSGKTVSDTININVSATLKGLEIVSPDKSSIPGHMILQNSAALFALSHKVIPDDAKNFSYKWESEAPSIAEIISDPTKGEINLKAKAPGTSTIKLTVVQAGSSVTMSDSVKVTVIALEEVYITSGDNILSFRPKIMQNSGMSLGNLKLPSDAASPFKYQWTTSDASLVSISSATDESTDIKASAINEGIAVVTLEVTQESSGVIVSDEVEIEVYKPIPLTAVRILSPDMYVMMNDIVTLGSEISPDNASTPLSYRWYLLDDGVKLAEFEGSNSEVSVDIIGISPGIVTAGLEVYQKCLDITVSDEVKLKIFPDDSNSLSPREKTFYRPGESDNVMAIVKNKNLPVRWFSMNSSVAKVEPIENYYTGDPQAKVTSVGAGFTTIFAVSGTGDTEETFAMAVIVLSNVSVAAPSPSPMLRKKLSNAGFPVNFARSVNVSFEQTAGELKFEASLAGENMKWAELSLVPLYIEVFVPGDHTDNQFMFFKSNDFIMTAPDGTKHNLRNVMQDAGIDINKFFNIKRFGKNGVTLGCWVVGIDGWPGTLHSIMNRYGEGVLIVGDGSRDNKFSGTIHVKNSDNKPSGGGCSVGSAQWLLLAFLLFRRRK